MTRNSFKLGTVFNIPIEVNYSWFIILGLIVYTLALGYFPLNNPGLPAAAHWLMALIAALLLFLSLVAHELAHSLVAKSHNLPISGITLFIFGGVAHMEQEPDDPQVELKMALAGPAMSFVLALSFYFLTRLPLPGPLLAIAGYLFIVNFFIGLFNLIPGFPLDGGRVLRAILWRSFNDIKRATAIASAGGKAFAISLIIFGFYNLLGGSIISGIWFIFIGLFLLEAADLSYRQVAMKNVLHGVRVEQLMTSAVVSVPGNIPLDRLVDDFFFHYRFTAFPVIEDDLILGLVTVHDIKEIPKELWPAKNAKEAMIPVSSGLVVDPRTEVLSALAKMAANGFGRLLVIENNKLIGLLSQRDIMRLFEIKSEVSK